MTDKRPESTPQTATSSELSAGYIRDFISGQIVKSTPEEVDGVQEFARRLVEDYGYPKDHIQTRPQHRVRKRTSDEDKSYPVDIAVFRSEKRTEDNLFMIVECKKKTRKDGVGQLKLYLDMSAAEFVDERIHNRPQINRAALRLPKGDRATAFWRRRGDERLNRRPWVVSQVGRLVDRVEAALTPWHATR